MKDLLSCVHVVVKTLNLEILTLSFSRLSQRILLKCVQHDYFSSFNQSGHCFLALSLPLPLSVLNEAADVDVFVVVGDVKFAFSVDDKRWTKNNCKVSCFETSPF